MSVSNYHIHLNNLADILAHYLNQWLPNEPYTLEQKTLVYGATPPIPGHFLGREADVEVIKKRLGTLRIAQTGTPEVLAVHGWPGVGKTTLATVLAHDPSVTTMFPDGIFWASLGPDPNVMSKLMTWGHELGVAGISTVQSVDQAVAKLRAQLRDKRILVILDDVWQARDIFDLRVNDRCPLLITTRLPEVVGALALPPNNVYKLPVLTDEQSMRLLTTLAPTVVSQHPQPSLELVQALEGLPLALQVAGRLINTESSLGWSALDLLNELREGVKLLEAEAPPDLNYGAPTTVTVLFRKSTDKLDQASRDCFARLGQFVPKPATFDLHALQVIWHMKDPRPVVRRLVDRGLIEPAGSSRFQMHALLVQHARSLLQE